jgi:hypothetical protein
VTDKQKEDFPDFPGFVAAQLRRLEKGRELYGDQSLEKTPSQVLREVREEIEDICGWSYWAWRTVTRLIKELEGVKK